jgi:SEC-C motif
LSDIGEDDQHAFVVPPDLKSVFIDEGHWEDFKRSPQRRAQLEANEVSYVWDMLIEQFSKHIIGGTQYYTSHEGINNSERSVRLLAREGRTRRRMLAMALVGVVGEELPERGKRSRHVLPSRPGDPYYVFLLLWRPSDVSYEDFREVRRKLLEWYCMVIKTIYPEVKDIVRIATEDRTTAARSEDVIYLDARKWSEELQSEALKLQEEFGILREYKKTFDERVQEYPEIQTQPRDDLHRTARSMKGRDRNSPCPCGSGKKLKKCCGSTTARP